MTSNVCICYLTQNTPERRIYLKTSLYFLFKHFNEAYKYPVILFHEGDYDDEGKQDIINSIRMSCRDLVSFQALDQDDFTVPAHIDMVKVDRALAITPPPTPYWRNLKYRMMCRWWIVHFMKYVQDYEYVMRLDDDSFIEEKITKDLFEWMKENDLNYASNIIHTDCGLCCYGMKEFFEKEFSDKTDIIKEIFVPQEISMRCFSKQPFRSLLSVLNTPLADSDVPDKVTLWMPTMYYNNFFITKTAFWRTPEMVSIIDKIDKDGSIFYYRWGDAPLQSILVMLMSPPEKIKKAKFAYSKRLQREAFKSNDGAYHSYMPLTYTNSSCMTER